MAVRKESQKIDIRRNEILEHFQAVLKEEGFEGASMAKIAKKMDVNPSLLIHYFSTKEEMILALVDFILEKFETLLLEKTRKISSTEKRLETLINTLFSRDWVSMVDSSAYYSCYYLTFRNRKVKQRMQKLYQRFRDGLEELLRSCMDEGIILSDDPAKLADFIIYLVEGLSFYRNISGGAKRYVETGAYLKNKVWNVLRQDRGPFDKSGSELLSFKKETVLLVKELHNQVEELDKKISEL